MDEIPKQKMYLFGIMESEIREYIRIINQSDDEKKVQQAYRATEKAKRDIELASMPLDERIKEKIEDTKQLEQSAAYWCKLGAAYRIAKETHDQKKQ